jgi:peptide/nickel transport system permease protein
MPVDLGARQVLGEQVSPRRAAIRRFLRHRLAIVGVFMLLVIMLLALLAPLLTPWPPNWVDFQTGARHAPNAAHVLGTDVSARDIWARLLYGGRTSIIVGFGAVAL